MQSFFILSEGVGNLSVILKVQSLFEICKNLIKNAILFLPFDNDIECYCLSFYWF